MNTPNKLTVLRMVLTPFFLAALIIEAIPHNYLFGLVFFSVAAITDFIDGKLARKNNQITVFGKLLDPVADKMLTTAAFLGFMQLGICNIWIVMIVLTREFVVTSLRLVASAQGIVVAANFWGKAKTMSQMVSIVVILVAGEAITLGILPSGFNLSFFSNFLLWITAVLTVISGIKYAVDISRQIDVTM